MDGPEQIARAVDLLHAGECVAFPTETVYGVGADALDPGAVERVFELKGRPASNPLIVHVDGEPMARAIAADWTDAATTLARAFWPGPLTLVVPKGERVPDIVTAGGPTVALRAPAHPIALALISAFGGPLVGPSANPSGRLSPTRADHVEGFFEGRLFVLDGGPCERGIESTVLDLTRDTPRILRQGVITPGVLEDALGGAVDTAAVEPAPGEAPDVDDGAPHRSPGRHGPHYRPRSALVVLGPDEHPAGDDHLIELPPDGAAAAALLYASLHEADRRDPARIAVRLPAAESGDPGVWAAIRERLGRAAGG